MLHTITKSLKNKALLLLLAFGLIPLLTLSVVTNKTTSSILNDKISYVMDQTINNLSLIIADNLQNLMDMTFFFSKNHTIAAALKYELRSDEDKLQAYYNIKAEITGQELMTRFLYPFHYLVFTKHDTIYTSFTYLPTPSYPRMYMEVEDTDWFTGLRSSYSESTVMFSSPHLLFLAGSEQLYTACNIISDFDNIGIVTIGIDKRFFTKLLDNARLNEKSSTYIVDSSGNCLLEGEKNYYRYTALGTDVFSGIREYTGGTRKLKVKGNEFLAIHKLIHLKGIDDPLNIVILTPIRELYREKDYFNNITIILVVICISAILFMVVLMEKEIVNPILRLHSYMKEVRGGNLDVQVDKLPENELGQLGEGFNEMIRDLKNYIEDIRLREKARRVLEIGLLQSQIKPHFVRNTLNFIRWMAEMKGAGGISKAILSFSSLLEYNFKDMGLFTTVRDELNYTEEYIYLQKLRYQNKFTSHLCVDDDILSSKILKLSFQPIVENSISHGLAPKKDMGHLEIKGYREGDSLVFEIMDDGVGMEPETLEKALISESVLDSQDKYERIALANVQQRLKMNFGDAYGIIIESTLGKGTKVRMVFPVL